MTLYPQLIIDALKTVRYPGTGKNIVEMGMMEDDLRIAGMHVSFSLLFDKPTNPFLKSLVKASEAAIHAYVSKDVEVEIRTLSPKSSPDGEGSAASSTPSYAHLGNIIAVSSGKGGVGKSTVAANLAIGLARLGHRVGLLDCDIFGPSMPKMFQVENERPYSEEIDGKAMIVPIEKYGVKMLSIGFFVDPDTPTLWRGGMASNALKQLIGEAAWGELDYFILDTPPGTSDIHLTLVQTLPITGAAHPGTGGEHELVHAGGAARQSLLHLRPRGCEGAGRGDECAAAGTDPAGAERLREWRQRRTGRAAPRDAHRKCLPSTGRTRGHTDRQAERRDGCDEDCGNALKTETTKTT